MEQNNKSKLLVWIEKNNQALLTLSVVAVAVVLIASFVIWSKIQEKNKLADTNELPPITQTMEVLDLGGEAQNNQAAVISAITEAGKGEVVFVVSAQTDSIIREIQLHNPHKNSWVVAYDGYKSVSQMPTEVFRAKLAAINYDLVQVRTLDNFYPLTKEVLVQDGQTTTVNLDLQK